MNIICNCFIYIYSPAICMSHLSNEAFLDFWCNFTSPFLGRAGLVLLAPNLQGCRGWSNIYFSKAFTYNIIHLQKTYIHI